ncbi:hypothetical protein AVEN_264177-1 [Araneus ventricosus]|uniref:Uncharacterized protein n=1 Tax=Araneus ventricosus TaxID=182803 RepID=A0A4Y2VTG4_ARAVE|nr:hypothetical protein AVEN_264177-1 [Araneus ventricosus]
MVVLCVFILTCTLAVGVKALSYPVLPLMVSNRVVNRVKSNTFAGEVFGDSGPGNYLSCLLQITEKCRTSASCSPPQMNVTCIQLKSTLFQPHHLCRSQSCACLPHLHLSMNPDNEQLHLTLNLATE